MISKEKIKAYALKNALAYDGKARVDSVLSSLFHEGLKKEDVKNIIDDVKKEVNRINRLTKPELEDEFSSLKKLPDKRKEREGLPELPNVNKEKGVIMRIAPSASGPLHIGSAIVASINFLYVKRYGGKFYVRIEDTNPENVYEDSYSLLEEDGKWLSKGKAKIVIQSKRMNLYYRYAGKLINKKKAYVCCCSQENFKKLADKKKECPCRKNSVKENIRRWKRMLSKVGYGEGEAVLRIKSDIKDKNPALRDFPLARISLNEHPRQGRKYRVWPLMNLAVAIDDIDMAMTHLIRGKDHRDNAMRQEIIFRALGKKYPWTAFIGKYHFKDLELSTSKFRLEIKAGKYKGWNDKKLPTLISLREQGYKPEAFWKLAENIGLSEVDKVISKKDFFSLLDRFNKE